MPWMFQRADQILIQNKEDDFALHALDFSWEGFEPSLTVFDRSSREVSEFNLEEIDFFTSKKRTCIGYFGDDGYIPCPKNATVDRFAQCPECCKEVFLPDQACVFEPKCDGEKPKCGADKEDTDFCRREHALYVAFYDTRMKIGMSSTRRVERRLIEQGADAYAIIGTMQNRVKAREVEKAVSAKLGIPQWVRQDAQLRNFARKVDVSGIEGRYEGLEMTLNQMPSMRPEGLKWLNGYPIDLPLSATPNPQDSWGRHKGRCVGIKGKWLIYEQDGLKALNISDFPARFLARSI